LLLADHFLERYAREHNKAILRISTPAIDMLTAYHFPGNVRELENAIERAVTVCDANVIHGHHLPPTLQTAEVSDTVTQLTLTSAVEAFESDLIQDALKSSRGNVARAAKMLDSTERILGYKIKKYSIAANRFKRGN
ncbi:MAG: helix-turn-helix domain-containing protein, partial [Pyrinomonadaceae bacterium]